MSGANHVVLVAGDIEAALPAGTIVHWNRLDVPAEQESLPRQVELHWRRARGDHLAWVHALGERKVAGGTIKSRLRVRDGLSLWWMTLIAEQSPMKSRTIFVAAKLRAFERLCDERGWRSVSYIGNERAVDRVLARWCRNTGRAYERRPARATARRPEPAMGRRVRFLPHPLRGLAWFAWIWWCRVRKVRARRARLPRPLSDGAPTTIVTYFPNFNSAAAADGRFVSQYWQSLHGLFARLPGPVDWIWMYAPSGSASLPESLAHRDRFNAASRGAERYRLLEEFVVPSVFVRAIAIYIRTMLRAIRLLAARDGLMMGGSRMDLGPILREDWKASLTGIVAAEAAYYACAFDAMADGLPVPVRALYVFENQAWEQALIAAWRRRGAGMVIAHQHEAVKPLNLRLFADPHTYLEAGPDAKNLPDVLAVGSEAARSAFLESGFPPRRLRLVESLRFGNAAPATCVRSPTYRHLLIVTGYLAPETRRMLELVAEADSTGALAGYATILIKPHPFLSVDKMLAGLTFSRPVEVTREGLEALWARATIVFIANSTAAVFDARAAGVSFCIYVPNDDFNLSPALGWDWVTMIIDAKSLAVALTHPPRARPNDVLFCTDPALPRWTSILGLDGETSDRGARRENAHT